MLRRLGLGLGLGLGLLRLAQEQIHATPQLLGPRYFQPRLTL